MLLQRITTIENKIYLNLLDFIFFFILTSIMLWVLDDKINFALIITP